MPRTRASGAARADLVDRRPSRPRGTQLGKTINRRVTLPAMTAGLAAKIAARQFVVTGELTPPKGTDLSRLFEAAELLRPWVDAINITESPRARMSMDARAVAKLLLDRGIETLVQITSRDRN